MILVGGICILLPLAFIFWIIELVQRMKDKRHPQPKRKQFSITDFSINVYRGPGRH